MVLKGLNLTRMHGVEKLFTVHIIFHICLFLHFHLCLQLGVDGMERLLSVNTYGWPCLLASRVSCYVM